MIGGVYSCGSTQVEDMEKAGEKREKAGEKREKVGGRREEVK